MSHDYDEDADLIAGFENADLSQDTSDAVDKTDKAQETPAAAEPAPAVDPFAGLPQAVRDLLGTIPKMQTELDGLRRTAGMVPALQSRIDKLSAQPVEKPAAPKFSKVEALRDELPDIADALDEIAAHLPTIQTRTDEPQPVETTSTPEPKDPSLELLDDVRPTWAEDLFSTDCTLWMQTLPPARQQEIKSTSKPSVILKALGEFDAYRQSQTSAARTQELRRQRITSGVQPRGDGRSVRGAAVEDDEDADMEAGFYGRRR